jgi:hypothetical protein
MSHDLTVLLDDNFASDLRLALYETNDQSQCLAVLHLHKAVLYSSRINYFGRLAALSVNGQFTENDTVNLCIDTTQGYTVDMMRHFMRLVYMNHSTLGKSLRSMPVMAHYVDEHLLHFNQLAHRFMFEALQRYCVKRLATHFSEENFEQFHEHCLQYTEEYGHTVRSEAQALYDKLMRWQRRCQHPVCESNRLHWDGQSGRVEFSQRLCERCLFSDDESLYGMRFVNLRGIKKNDDSVRCSFSVMRQSHTTKHWSLCVNLVCDQQQQTNGSSSSSSDDMSVEHSGEENRMSIQTELSLFSQKNQPLQWASQRVIMTDCVTELLPFRLHKEKHSFEGECSHCSQHSPLYIFEISLSVSIIKSE